MTAALQRGSVSTYVRACLEARLNERRVVVWYDSDGAFVALAGALDLPDTVVVSAAASMLRARRAAEEVYRRLNDGDGSPESKRNLLIYVPHARGMTAEAQQQDPFEGFACCGATFGAHEGERLMALAQGALPAQAAEIARLFREGRPSLELLDGLSTGTRYPLVRQALGDESPAETIAHALGRSDTADRLESVPGARAELARMAEAALGLPPHPGDDWSALRERLASFLLAGELAADLPDGLPPELASVPHAEGRHAVLAREICERLRDSDAGREAYMTLARTTERALRLEALLGDQAPAGDRDTFPVQERGRLRAVVSGDLLAANEALRGAERSVWRRDPERLLLWQVAGRCLEFLACAANVETTIPTLKRDPRTLIETYTADEGLWRLDRAQRLFEHAAAQLAQEDEVEPLVQRCRVRYREVVDAVQGLFQAAVAATGWPPEGVRRQTQTFDSYVAPELAERRKTAYILVDGLRYEMGRDLTEALRDLGEVRVEGVASVLPTTTPCGMAALMPGADGAFSLVELRGELAPAIGATALPGIDERRALLASRYRDRLIDLTLEDVISIAPKKLRARIGVADLAIVRTQDIDELGESANLYRARQIMSNVIGELRDAAVRLADLGFQTLVFAADHGHMLVPEVLPGDVLSIPPGAWLLKKRRALLGRAQGSAPGVLTLSARDAGIIGPVDDFAVASGFKTFRDGAGYFHEGVSLQECVVPIVVALPQRPQAASGGERVTIGYRSDRFTSSVIGLKVELTASLFNTELTIRLEVFDSSGPKARLVGQVAECDARNPATGEITLRAGTETPVPLVIDTDYAGPRVEIRAIDPRTGVVLHRLTLKNDRLV